MDEAEDSEARWTLDQIGKALGLLSIQMRKWGRGCYNFTSYEVRVQPDALHGSRKEASINSLAIHQLWWQHCQISSRGECHSATAFPTADRCADCRDDQLEKFKPHELPPYETMQFTARADSALSGTWKQLTKANKHE